ncbi:hypothetical protein AC1031_002759 [Aphanomyces cochlioides]|nr:hypothetical protein AC1031_002759 [Aphanomyces cochlioides]
MGQVIACCFGAADASNEPPKPLIAQETSQEPIYTLDHIIDMSMIEPPLSPVDVLSRTVDLSGKMSQIQEETTEVEPNGIPMEATIEQEPIPEPSLASPDETTGKRIRFATQRSLSESDMSTDTMTSTWSRSSSLHQMTEDDVIVPPRMVLVKQTDPVQYSVKVVHFTPHLTGSIYDFEVTLPSGKQTHVFRTRHACKKFYTSVKHLQQSKRLPPFPPKAGLGILGAKDTYDANSCSFMQDFLDHILSHDFVRNAPVTQAFFGILHA